MIENKAETGVEVSCSRIYFLFADPSADLLSFLASPHTLPSPHRSPLPPLLTFWHIFPFSCHWNLPWVLVSSLPFCKMVSSSTEPVVLNRSWFLFLKMPNIEISVASSVVSSTAFLSVRQLLLSWSLKFLNGFVSPLFPILSESDLFLSIFG